MTSKPLSLSPSLSMLAGLLAASLFAGGARAQSSAPAKTAAGTAAAAGATSSKAAAAAVSLDKEADPVVLLKKKDGELQRLLRESPRKTDRIKFLINDIFDFEELGRRALGPETWKKMTPAQQARFVKAFRRMVENASVKKLEVYQADSTVYEAPQYSPEKDKATVVSRAFSKGQQSELVYKMFRKDGAWRAWDLVIDELSTARNYGEQFRKILQTSTVDGLIAKVEKRAKAGGEASTTDTMKSKSVQENKGAAAGGKTSTGMVKTTAAPTAGKAKTGSSVKAPGTKTAPATSSPDDNTAIETPAASPNP